jgi:outer membrane protein assembly factor BamB
MGLLKYLLLIFVIVALYGCGPSSIKLKTRIDDNAYSMFGRAPGREFYIPISITDSLVERWEAEVNGSFTNSSVAVSDSFIFVNDLSGRISCFRIDSGEMAGQLKNDGTVYSTPIIHKFLVIYADAYNSEDKSNLVYYDFSLGKIVNETEVQGRVLTQLIKTENGIIFVTETGTVMKHNFISHKVWETHTGFFVHSSPVLSNDKIIFGNDQGEIIAAKESNGEILYRIETGAPFFGNAAVSGGTAFIGNDNGELIAFDIENGNLKWKYRTDARIIANPVSDDKYVIIANLSGDVYKLDKETGQLIWKQSTGGVINATPLLTKNRIIVPNLYGSVIFLNYETGAITKTITYPDRVRLSPLIIDKYLYIGYDKGMLKSYEIFF